MTLHQRKTLVVGLMLCAVAGLYPPWKMRGGGNRFAVLWRSPTEVIPSAFGGTQTHRGSLNFELLLIEWAVIVIVSVAVFLLLGGRKTVR